MTIEATTKLAPLCTEEAWNLYDSQVQALLQPHTPFRQSLCRDEFDQVCSNPDFIKFIARRDSVIVGIGITTNDISQVPWLSPSFFERTYRDISSNHIWYLVGISVRSTVMTDAPRLLKRMIEDFLGRRSIGEAYLFCYDHSTVSHHLYSAIGSSLSGKHQMKSAVVDRMAFVICD